MTINETYSLTFILLSISIAIEKVIDRTLLLLIIRVNVLIDET